ncbi:hypothetical protein [uncultured Treponema sp.]|nr:hypothetical protein [uncultured Treponema sp.]
MNNYQYYIKMKNICEERGREKPELRCFFLEARKVLKTKPLSLNKRTSFP